MNLVGRVLQASGSGGILERGGFNNLSCLNELDFQWAELVDSVGLFEK